MRKVLTFEHADGGWVIINSAGGPESGCADGGRWDQIVGECVVEISLREG